MPPVHEQPAAEPLSQSMADCTVGASSLWPSRDVPLVRHNRPTNAGVV